MQGWFSLVVTIRVILWQWPPEPEPLTPAWCEGHQWCEGGGRCMVQYCRLSEEDEQTRARVSSVASTVTTTPGHHNNSSTEATTAVATTAHRIQIWRWDQFSANFTTENQSQVTKKVLPSLFVLRCGAWFWWWHYIVDYQSNWKILYFVHTVRQVDMVCCWCNVNPGFLQDLVTIYLKNLIFLIGSIRSSGKANVCLSVALSKPDGAYKYFVLFLADFEVECKSKDVVWLGIVF